MSRIRENETPVDPQSSSIIANLAAAGGFGNGRFQIDFSITVLTADATTPFRSFTPTGDFYSPDCDLAPVPVPTEWALEGESGYGCVGDGGCHLLVLHQPTHRLFEGTRVIARALQRYGMILSDGGNIALTAADDRFTVAKWDDVLPSGSTGLAAIHVTDFEMIDAGIRIPLTYDCVRNP